MAGGGSREGILFTVLMIRIEKSLKEIMDYFRDPIGGSLYLNKEGGMVPSGKTKKIMSNLQFFGRVFEGHFNEKGNTHVKLILQRDDIAKLVKLAKEAKEAVESGGEFPDGVGEYDGEWQIKLELKQPRDKNKKPYCTLDTYKGGGSEKKKEAVKAFPEEEDDLPF